MPGYSRVDKLDASVRWGAFRHRLPLPPFFWRRLLLAVGRAAPSWLSIWLPAAARKASSALAMACAPRSLSVAVPGDALPPLPRDPSVLLRTGTEGWLGRHQQRNLAPWLMCRCTPPWIPRLGRQEAAFVPSPRPIP